MKRKTSGIFIIFSLLLFACARPGSKSKIDIDGGGERGPRRFTTVTQLTKLNIDPTTIGFSGVSSGAFMSVQMNVIHSDLVSNIGLFAGGIFNCAQGQVATAITTCMGFPSSIDVAKYVNLAKQSEAAGKIAPLRQLARSGIYIFASPKDAVVKIEAGKKLAEFYQNFMSAAQIKLETSVHAAHGWPTLSKGLPCATQGIPWIQNCGFDGSGEVLKSALKNQLSQPRRDLTQDEFKLIQRFDQNEFGAQTALLASEGFAFIPKTCLAGTKCHLHVALHGCQQNEEYAQTQFVENAGLNEWAVDNNIVVLYPQTRKTTQNTNACWDWFGYTGPEYATKSGLQIQFLKKLINQVSGT